jgi:mono/diheme cytochrome c family protein
MWGTEKTLRDSLLAENRLVTRFGGRMVKHASAAVVVVLLTAVWNLQGTRVVEGAFRSRQETDTQELEKRAKGMEAVGKACVQCHALRPVTLQRKTADQWRDTVHGMIGRGAQVKPDEIEPITSYLAASFGPQTPVLGSGAGQAATRSQTSPPSTGTLPEGSGRVVLMERCVACHTSDVAVKPRQSKEQWVEAIRKMRALGAVLSAEEEKVVAAYLAENFGPSSP